MKFIMMNPFNKESEILSKELVIGSILYSCLFFNVINNDKSFQ